MGGQTLGGDRGTLELRSKTQRLAAGRRWNVAREVVAWASPLVVA